MTQKPYGVDPPPLRRTLGVADGVAIAASSTAATTSTRLGLGLAAAAARLQSGLLVFEYVVLLGFCRYGIVTGPHPFSLSWFDPFQIPSTTALAQGLLLSVFCYWGFEAAFTVNEEVRDPRDASRAGTITLVTMLTLFLNGSGAFKRGQSGPAWAGHGA